jgi:hypothetical protein
VVRAGSKTELQTIELRRDGREKQGRGEIVDMVISERIVLEKGNNVKHTPYTTINSLNNITLLLSRPKEHTNALVVIHQYNTDLAILPSPYTLLKSQARHMMRQATFRISFCFCFNQRK